MATKGNIACKGDQRGFSFYYFPESEKKEEGVDGDLTHSFVFQGLL